MLTIALLLAILTAGVAAGKLLDGGAWQPPVARAHSGGFYGANESLVASAATEWPQKANNWCAVANIEVIANYTYEVTSGTTTGPFLTGGQQRIANDLDSNAAVSQWGNPSWNGIGPGFRADIARDGGTDPRSIAWGIDDESIVSLYTHTPGGGTKGPKNPPGLPSAPYAYHDVIYHNATNHALAELAIALEYYHLPISVTMAHGLHSDIVSGVYANADPITGDPADVDAVNVWDPAVGTSTGGYQSAREVTWDNYSFNADPNMWGTAYSSNNGYDPDPAVGIYAPNGQYPNHWINFLTAIVPDTNVSLSPDYALDEHGTVMTHP